MGLSWVALGMLGVCLWGVTLAQGGVYVADSAWAVLGMGLAGVAAFGRRELHPGGWWGVGLAAGFWGVGAWQWAAGVTQVPVRTAEAVMEVGGYVVAFAVARELVWSFRRNLWWVAAPVIGIGTVQAGLGLVQWWLQRAAGQSPMAVGSYNSKNSYAGLLEMTLPLAVWAGVWVYVRERKRGETGVRESLGASALFAMGAAMLVGTVISLSRMGFLAALSGMVATGVVAAGGRGGKRVWPALMAVGVGMAAFVFLPTDEWIARFAGLAVTEDVSSDTRVQLWKETWPAIVAYGWKGCGLGGYESCFYAFKKVAPDSTADYAHNDYLQVLLEMGWVGFAVGMGLVGRVVGRLWWVTQRSEGGAWYLGVGCMGAMVALGLHSLVDFNLYFPANAMVAAWVLGMGEGLPAVAKWEIGRMQRLGEKVVEG